jgi:aspartate/methionine/tyrosine aminotransferase
MFPSIDLKGTPWRTDMEFVLDLIKTEGVVTVQGSGFCQEFGQDHFRALLLPPMETLEKAYDKIDRFMAKRVA